MKKVIIGGLVMVILFTLAISGALAQKENITILVNGNVIQTPNAKPYLDSIAERVHVPIRFVSEALGANVGWSSATKTVKVKNNTKTIVFKIGESVAKINDETIELDSPAHIRNERTYVPLRFISEALDAEVNWDNDLKQVLIRQLGVELPPQTADEILAIMQEKYADRVDGNINQYGINIVDKGFKLVKPTYPEGELYVAFTLNSDCKDMVSDALKLLYPTQWSTVLKVALEYQVAEQDMTNGLDDHRAYYDQRYTNIRRLVDGVRILVCKKGVVR